MRFIKSSKLFSLTIFLMFVTASTVGAVNVTLEPSSSTVSIGGTVDLMVKVDDAMLDDGTGLAGAAFTIEYDPTKVFVLNDLDGSEIQGEFGAGDNFSSADAFNESFSDTSGDSIFPIVGNNVPSEGMVMMSGAYVDPTTGEGAYDGPQTLFTIRFKTREEPDVQDGDALNFSLTKTNLTNTAANWNGEDVPPLMGVVPDGNNTPDNISDDFEEVSPTLPATATIVEIASFLKGDINNSGSLPNATDALFVLALDAELIPTDQIIGNGDINCSGGLPNATDALFILALDAELITYEQATANCP